MEDDRGGAEVSAAERYERGSGPDALGCAETAAPFAYVAGWPMGNMPNRGAAVTCPPPIRRACAALANAIRRAFTDETPVDREAIQPMVDQLNPVSQKMVTQLARTSQP